MRLERRAALKEVKKREQQVVDTLQLTSEICTQRHHEGLFRKMRELLPAAFGFEAVGVYMYNYETKQFFTDLDTSKDEQKEAKKSDDSNDDDGNDEEEDKSLERDTDTPTQATKKAEKSRKEGTKKPVNYHKKKLNPNMTEEEKRQRIREIHAK